MGKRISKKDTRRVAPKSGKKTPEGLLLDQYDALAEELLKGKRARLLLMFKWGKMLDSLHEKYRTVMKGDFKKWITEKGDISGRGAYNLIQLSRAFEEKDVDKLLLIHGSALYDLAGGPVKARQEALKVAFKGKPVSRDTARDMIRKAKAGK